MYLEQVVLNERNFAPSKIISSAAFPLAELMLGRKIGSKLDVFRTWQQDGPEERRARRTKSLISTLEYARQHIPYYSALFKKIRFQIDKLNLDLRYFEELPFLTKEIINAQPEAFISDQFSKKNLIERRTSGSSGRTFSVYYSQAELDWTSAANLFLNENAGHNLSRKEIHFSSRDPGKTPFWGELREFAKCLVLNRTNIQVSDLNEADIRKYIRMIKKLKPSALYGLPSTIKGILYSNDNSDGDRSLAGSFDCFISTGENLNNQTAEFLKKTVGCRVLNRFGNAEFGAFAQSYDDVERLDFIDGIVFPETFAINTDISELVLTTLINRAMPLIRYRTGDLARLRERSTGSFEMYDLNGRTHEFFPVNGKTYSTSYFRDYLERHFAIHDFQIILRQTGLEFRIMSDSDAKVVAIQKDLASLLGANVIASKATYTDFIRLGYRQKLSYLVTEAALGKQI